MISTNHKHRLTRAEARQKVEQFARTWGHKIKAQWRWDGDTLHFTGDMARGSITVTATAVKIQCELLGFAVLKEAEVRQGVQQGLRQVFQ